MTNDLINADFSQRVVLATDDLPWLPSPQAGVERRLLDRIGGEIARATSLVRYAPDSSFPAHEHALGEEFLVIDGVFSDEHGDYPTGTYVRNPPGTSHTPSTAPGCTILVKLRQMTLNETERVVIDTNGAPWRPNDVAGHSSLELHRDGKSGEVVTMERLEPGTEIPDYTVLGGEELFLISGDLSDDKGNYGPRHWIRNPPGSGRRLRSRSGAVYWAKRGHLRDAPPPDNA